MAKSELKILIGLHRAANTIDRETARAVAPFGLTLSQFAVLEALLHKGDCTVGQVQRKVLSSAGTIPLVVNNLEKLGYVERRQDAADKRRTILHLTAAGRAVIERAYPVNEALICNHMDCWTAEEKQTLAALLKKFGDYYGT